MAQGFVVSGVSSHPARPERSSIAAAVFADWEANAAVLDADGRIEMVTDAWERFAHENGGFGLGAGSDYFEVCRRSAAEEPLAAEVLDGLHKVLDGELAAYHQGYPCHSPDEHRWFDLTARRLTVEGRSLLLVVHHNVTQTRQIHEDAHVRSMLLDDVDAAVMATDLGGRVTAWNRAAERLYGWSSAQALGQLALDLAGPIGSRDEVEGYARALLRDGTWEGQVMVSRSDGSSIPVLIRNAVFRGTDGVVSGVVSVGIDLSARVAMEGQMARSYRELKAITTSVGDGLCTLDADGRISYVNPAGLALLESTVTEALGLRFFACVDDVGPGSDGRPDPDRDVGGTGAPVEAMLLRRDGTQLPIEYVATSMTGQVEAGLAGWVVVFRDITARRLREAELAVQVEQTQWLRRIRDGLEGDGFELHIQPIVDIATRATVQHEILLRLRDPDDDDHLIAPGRFLPIAEEFGLAPAIDRWVLRHAIDVASRGLPVQINVSGTSLGDPDLPLLIEQLQEESGADPATIMFEITETALASSDADPVIFAQRIHDLGCKLALDDFGTGYGGFTYLKQFPIDELKIDMEFVQDALANPASRHLISAVVSLGRAFGVRTVAEGVEDEPTLALLRELEVDLAQGYLFARPVSVESYLAGVEGGPDR